MEYWLEYINYLRGCSKEFKLEQDADEIYTDIVFDIIERRKAKHWTRSELARKCDLNLGTIDKLEKFDSTARADVIIKILLVLTREDVYCRRTK